MWSLESLPEYSGRRLLKVVVRSIHLVGGAGVFGAAMAHDPALVYVSLAIISGIVLVVMEAYSGWLWFVQLRGVAFYLKMVFLLLLHWYPQAAIPCLIAVIIISGIISHAPSWIRYYSLPHRRVVHSTNEIWG